MKKSKVAAHMRVLKIAVASWAKNRIDDTIGGKTSHERVSNLMQMAVLENDLFPILGKLPTFRRKMRGTSAVAEEHYGCVYHFQVSIRLAEAFETVAKAHGFTPRQALANLMSWVASHNC